MFIACSDARLAIPFERSISVRTIATGGPKDPYERLVNSRGVESIVVLAHHGGDTVQPGQKPNGCGGLGAKETINSITDSKQKTGIYRYLENDVQHPDVIIQAWVSAGRIAEHTNKPVLAATQDHLDGKAYPLAVFLNRGEEIRTKLKMADMLEGQYHPSEIYRYGIPTLSLDKLPEVFQRFMEENLVQVAEAQAKYPDLRERQKVQNPSMVVLSTDIRSMRIRYPTTSQTPGTLFKLNIPREKVGTKINISLEDLERSLDQAQYPIEHAVGNFGYPAKPFSKTNKILIETGSMDLSSELARRLTDQSWTQEWLHLPDHYIIVARTQAGRTHSIEQFVPAKT